jgi:hypothetical protein
MFCVDYGEVLTDFLLKSAEIGNEGEKTTYMTLIQMARTIEIRDTARIQGYSKKEL